LQKQSKPNRAEHRTILSKMPSNENGVSQGVAQDSKSYIHGIHVPSLTFFGSSPRQEIDWETQSKHLSFLIKSGVHGVVLAGTNGEAITLSRSEKKELVSLTRKLAVQHGRADLPITLGTSGTSTRDVIDDTVAAKESGADYVLVLVPAFFHFAMTSDAICEFFEEVGTHSPLPVIIYNWPGVTNGIEINSDYVDILGQHPNIVAIKFTCGGIAKVARVADRFEHKQFMALAGQSDWLVPALASGAGGAISGMANFYPKTLMHLQELFLSGDKNQEARVLQGKVATAEWALGKSGINGIKALTVKALGYPAGSSKPRRPYEDFSGNEKLSGFLETVQSIKGIEASLNKKA